MLYSLKLSIFDGLKKNMIVKSYYKKSLKFKVLDRITQQIAANIIIREDIADMGSSRQISRCLKDLIEMGELVKIGYGIYAKAYISKTLNKPVIQGGFSQACKEALTKKGIKWQPGSAEQAYNTGVSTQIPVRIIVQLKSRYRGHLSYGNRRLIMEKGINAK
jgi:hypothetical protein